MPTDHMQGTKSFGLHAWSADPIAIDVGILLTQDTNEMRAQIVTRCLSRHDGYAHGG